MFLYFLAVMSFLIHLCYNSTLTLVVPQSIHYFTIGLLASISPQTKYMSNKYITYWWRPQYHTKYPISISFTCIKITSFKWATTLNFPYTSPQWTIAFPIFHVTQSQTLAPLVVNGNLQMSGLRYIIHMSEHISYFHQMT